MSPPDQGKEDDLIDLALAEDLGPRGTQGDVTSTAFISEGSKSRAVIIARQACVVSGLKVAAEVFRRVDGRLEILEHCHEGKSVAMGTLLLEVIGSTRSLLSAERTALNFLGRLCGIATLARQYADEVAGTAVTLLDTRKTTPGWRVLEKQAVKAGGCANHRMGLYDAVLVKDNHLAALGDLALLPPVIDRLRSANPGLPVEIEADTIDQVEHLLGMTGIDVILLDNMTPEQMCRAVALRKAKGSRVLLEASGGVTLHTVRAIALTGVERISVGALTHSAGAADLAMELVHAG
jgi:nicotinate-nucleotide pyrophosphorylase (carboxylating)